MRSELSIEIAPAGDAIITRGMAHWSGYEPFDRLMAKVRSADASLVNLEVMLHEFEGFPAAQNPGLAMHAPPKMADELTWAGFDMVTAATNHAIDYSHGGMERTIEHLKVRDIPFAGLGRTRSEARAPAYLETPGGRVGLVNACSTVTVGSEAGPEGFGVKGRPGIAPIRLDVEYTVPAEDFHRLREISENLGLEEYQTMKRQLGFPVHVGDGFKFVSLGANNHPTIKEGTEYAVRRRPDEDDIEPLLKSVKSASQQADWVVASLHAHEGTGAMANDESMAPFIIEFAHSCIEAGADLFFGHGSHCLRGIEVYQGSPIFYSLGNFVAQNETIERIPPELFERYGLDAGGSPAEFFNWRYYDAAGERTSFIGDRKYFESILPIVRLCDDSAATVDIYPVDLGFDLPRPRRGTPKLASGETATRIFDRLTALSEPFGTTIEVENDVGSVVVEGR